jgi:hypothetical protein
MNLEKNTTIKCFEAQGVGSSFIRGNRVRFEGDCSPEDLR